MINDPTLAPLFIEGDAADTATDLVFTGTMTAWNSTTYNNIVEVVPGYSFTNLPVINPAGLSTGPVLLLRTSGRPIILGRIYQA